MADLLPSDPAEIGPYVVLGRIGAGGMGVVYRVAGPDGTRAALKLIRTELSDDAAFRARFRWEVEAGQRVGGMCNARYIAADLDAERPYLVTEYVPGGNLADYVAAHGPMQGDQLVSLAVGLAEALVAMSAVGVVHRDLKPSNVLMGTSGPKVVDFGIAHAADGTALTQTGLMIGSPSWMAPEQAVGQGGSAATDVFSWGATVAFAATGRSPFGEGRPDAVLYRVVHEQPDLRGVDSRLIAVVRQALEKDPARRQSPGDLLIGVIGSGMAGAVPVGSADAMTTAVLDRTWHQGAPFAAGAETTTSQSPNESPIKQRNVIWLGAAALVAMAALVAGGIAVGSRSPTHQTISTVTSTTAANRPPTATTPASAPASTTPNTTSPPTDVSTDLALVACPTTGPGLETNPPALPSTYRATVPSNLVNQLAAYTDQEGEMKVIAPTGWKCSSLLAEDGGSNLAVYPQGQTDPTANGASHYTGEAVVGTQSGACAGCMSFQATPLFAQAASECASNFAGSPSSCPAPFAGETVQSIGDGIAEFFDPPGVAGSGNPSGGPFPANGVATWHPSSTSVSPSYLETCTLPQSQHALCTAVLDSFVLTYGSL